MIVVLTALPLALTCRFDMHVAPLDERGLPGLEIFI